MAEIKTLAATVRSGTGKGAARSVRREGKIPGVIYGGGEAPTPITLSYRDMNKLIYAGHFLTTIFEIDIDGKKERAIPRDYQLDVVRDTPLHVDFLRLKAGSRLKVNVPVHFLNQDTAPGIKRGGSLNIVLHSVELLVPADNIPESIVADLGGLDFNDALHISAVKLPEGVTPIDRSDFTIVTIAPPAGGAEAAAADAAAAAAAAAAPAKGAPAKAAPKAAPAKK
jgi:large subunit ribosomal protein L25